MSGVHDDLATLRENIEYMRGVIPKQDSRSALARVEAEIARLREQATQDRATILLREGRVGSLDPEKSED